MKVGIVMRRREFWGFGFLSILAACRGTVSRAGELCHACQRPVHGATRTVAFHEGKRMTFCCPACAISESKQEGQTVEVLSLTDFDTGKEIPPDSALLVRGSDVNPCAEHAPPGPATDKRPMQVTYDRCAPGLLAFPNRAAAETFARNHGGTILTWKDVRGAAKP